MLRKSKILTIIFGIVFILLLLPGVLGATAVPLKNVARATGHHYPTLYTDKIDTTVVGTDNIAFLPTSITLGFVDLVNYWVIESLTGKLNFRRALGSNLLTLDGINGRVGIGTDTPSATLHVSSGSNAAIQINSGAPAGQIGVASGVGAFSSFATAGDVILRSMTNNRDLILTAARDGALRFGTKDGVALESEKVTILPNGNLGIGTNTPMQKLHIAGGNALVEGSVSSTGLDVSGATNLVYTSAGPVLTIENNHNTGGKAITFRSQSVDRGYITSDGSLMLGNPTNAIGVGELKYNGSQLLISSALGANWESVGFQGSGPSNVIARWTSSGYLGGSSINDDGSTVVVTADLQVDGNIDANAVVANSGSFSNFQINGRSVYISERLPPGPSDFCFTGSGTVCDTLNAQCDPATRTYNFFDEAFPSKAACISALGGMCQNKCFNTVVCTGDDPTLDGCSGFTSVNYSNVANDGLYCQSSRGVWSVAGSCTCELTVRTLYRKEIMSTVAGAYCATFGFTASPPPPS